MAFSYVGYPDQTGATTDYAVPFGFLDRSHVSATVDGVSASFTWLTDGMIRMDTAPTGDLLITRVTPSVKPEVTFVDGSTHSAVKHNTQNLQLLYVAQEAADTTINTISGDGIIWDAANRRIKNVSDPVDPQDAVTKLWAETAMASNLAQAIAAKNSAVSAQSAAETARTGAQNAQSAAETARTGAQNAQSAAETAQGHAETAQGLAQGAASAAASSASAASTSETNAASSASAAATSESNASSSAISASSSASAAATSASDAEASADEAAAIAASITPADATEYRAKLADRVLSPVGVWDSAAVVTATYAASVALDLNSGINFEIDLTGDLTLSNPTNAKVGQTGFIKCTQDATGGRSISFGSNWKASGGILPTLTPTASAVDLLFYQVISPTLIVVNNLGDVK